MRFPMPVVTSIFVTNVPADLIRSLPSGGGARPIQYDFVPSKNAQVVHGIDDVFRKEDALFTCDLVDANEHMRSGVEMPSELGKEVFFIGF